jgi:hypothetical protein
MKRVLSIISRLTLILIMIPLGLSTGFDNQGTVEAAYYLASDVKLIAADAADNTPPVSGNLTITTNEDTPVSITLTASDPDPSDLITYSVVTPPQNGTLGPVSSDLTYTSNSNYYGSDSFTYQAFDGFAYSGEAIVNIEIKPVNDAPNFITGADQTVQEDFGAQIVTGWATNISPGPDNESDQTPTFLIDSNTNPNLFSAGPAVSNTGTLTYAPAPNANGSAIMGIRLQDSGGTENGGVNTSSTRTFTITITPVNDAPEGVGDAYSVNRNTALNVSAATGVLSNDTDIDNDPLTAELVAGPAHSLTFGLNADGSFSYTPGANYYGSDSFTYKAKDSQAESPGVIVNITINGTNAVPLVNDQSLTTNEDTTLTIVLTGTDPDGDTLTYSVSTPPAHGTLSGAAPGLTYMPNPNYYGSDSLTYRANDGITTSGEAIVDITVSPVNDVPAAIDDNTTTQEDSPVVIVTLANDTDPDGNSLSVTGTTDPVHGTAIVNPDNTISYTPDQDWFGDLDFFTYSVSDDFGGLSSAYINITITPVNDAPVAVADSYSTNENAPLNVSGSGILGNDTDVDSSTLMTIKQTDPTNGTLTLNSNGSFTYIPHSGWKGTDSFTYRANDGSLDSNEVIVNISVIALSNGGSIGGGGSEGGSGGIGSSEEKQYLTYYLNPAKPGTFIRDAYFKTWDGLLRLNIPGGTSGETKEGWGLSYIVLQPVPQAEQNLDPPENGNIIGLTYKLGPDGATFDPPITITMLYNDDQIPSGVNEGDLVIGYWDTQKNQWEALDGYVAHTINNQITAPIDHFSTYAVLYMASKATPASFSISSPVISPSMAKTGEQVSISTTVTNNGGSAGIYNLILKINGTQLENREISLEAGQIQTVQFYTKQDVPGTYTINIGAMTGQLVVETLGDGVIASTSTSPPAVAIAPNQTTSPTANATGRPNKTSTVTPRSSVSPTPEKEKTGTPSTWIILFGVILTLVIIGGVLMLLRRRTS